MGRPRAALALLAALPVLAGCDPIWSISGAFFPAWLLCAAGGAMAAVVVRWGIARAGLEAHIGPRILVYAMLYAACTCTLWLLFFSR